jgi:hypothetical protein
VYVKNVYSGCSSTNLREIGGLFYSRSGAVAHRLIGSSTECVKNERFAVDPVCPMRKLGSALLGFVSESPRTCIRPGRLSVAYVGSRVMEEICFFFRLSRTRSVSAHSAGPGTAIECLPFDNAETGIPGLSRQFTETTASRPSPLQGEGRGQGWIGSSDLS